jgi:hypothetical protein
MRTHLHDLALDKEFLAGTPKKIKLLNWTSAMAYAYNYSYSGG